MPSTAQLDQWVRQKVSEAEGFADAVLIDFVHRRLGQTHDVDRHDFEKHLQILMNPSRAKARRTCSS